MCPNDPAFDDQSAGGRAQMRKFPARIAGYRGEVFAPVGSFIGKIKTRGSRNTQVYCVWTVTFINDECEISDGRGGDKAFML